MFIRTYRKLSDFVTRVKNTVVELAHLAVEWFQTTDKKEELAVEALTYAVAFTLVDLLVAYYFLGTTVTLASALGFTLVSFLTGLAVEFVSHFRTWVLGELEDAKEFESLSKELEEEALATAKTLGFNSVEEAEKAGFKVPVRDAYEAFYEDNTGEWLDFLNEVGVWNLARLQRGNLSEEALEPFFQDLWKTGNGLWTGLSWSTKRPQHFHYL
jgi:hypothetical protein